MSKPEVLVQKRGCGIASQMVHDTSHTLSVIVETPNLTVYCSQYLGHIGEVHAVYQWEKWSVNAHHSQFPQCNQYEGRPAHEGTR